ncbi:MAG: ATP-binding cassette domain-containing protein, partial [Mesorhizobium sp.]
MPSAAPGRFGFRQVRKTVMPDTEIILAVDAVHATYNHAITALHGVSFEVRRGEILALLGANGAGKTTTLKAVSNLLPAERGQVNAGTIRYEGSDVARRKPGDLVRAGLVPVLEGRHCFKSLTVEDNLVAGGIGRSGRRAEISADLERIYAFFPRLKEKRRTLSGLTSGGEQQMTAIGRALMSRPRLLVLD